MLWAWLTWNVSAPRPNMHGDAACAQGRTTAPKRTDAPSAHLGAQKRPLRTYVYI